MNVLIQILFYRGNYTFRRSLDPNHEVLSSKAQWRSDNKYQRQLEMENSTDTVWLSKYFVFPIVFCSYWLRKYVIDTIEGKLKLNWSLSTILLLLLYWTIILLLHPALSNPSSWVQFFCWTCLGGRYIFKTFSALAKSGILKFLWVRSKILEPYDNPFWAFD